MLVLLLIALVACVVGWIWPSQRKCFFINLKHRTDRLECIEREFKRMRLSGIRIEAIENKTNPAMGCSASHLAALDARNNDLPHMVFEDDACFNVDATTFHSLLKQLDGIVWDVILFCANVERFEQTVIPNMVRIHAAYTTAGYMVHQNYIDTFRSNVMEGITKGIPIDVHWLSLQRTGQWFAFHPVVCYQRDGFSDIEGRITHYRDKVPLTMVKRESPYIVGVNESSDIRVSLASSTSLDLRMGILKVDSPKSLDRMLMLMANIMVQPDVFALFAH